MAPVAKVAKTLRIATHRQTLTKALSKFALQTGLLICESGTETFLNSE
jgi:hypothetical protein